MDATYNRQICHVSRKKRCLWIEIDLEERVAVHHLSARETEIEPNSIIDRHRSGC